jgi:serine/threonine protein kinase
MSDPAVADPGGRRDAAPGEERLRERCLANSLWARFYQGWELIGRGGYGTVIGTRHRTFGEIAIKSFEWLSAQEEARFDQEAAALARLNHPSIVRIYGAFKDDGLYWFEMERVHGPTLKEALETRQKDGRPFATSEVLDIAIDVAEALRAAHAAGVIHRDVKPANVLLPEHRDDHGPRAKLGDFGVSRLFDAGRLTATGVVVGSYEYAAPELFAGRTAAAASDVYAFTLLLYRLLTGNSYPYEINGDRTPVAFMEAHTKQVPLPIGFLNRDLSQELQDVITLGLAKDPRRRPSWDEIVAALGQEQTGLRLVSERETASRRSPPAVSRSTRAFLRRVRSMPAARYFVGATVATIAGLSLVVARGLPPPAPAPSATVPQQKAIPNAQAARRGLTTPVATAGPAETDGKASASAIDRGPAADAVVHAAGPVTGDRSPSQLGVTVEMAGDTLRIRNVSDRAASVRVTAITRTGSRHSATISGLEPGLQQTIFLDGLHPPLMETKDIVRVDVVELSSSRKRPIRLDQRPHAVGDHVGT